MQDQGAAGEQAVVSGCGGLRVRGDGAAIEADDCAIARCGDVRPQHNGVTEVRGAQTTELRGRTTVGRHNEMLGISVRLCENGSRVR